METKGLEDDLKRRMIAHGEWDRCVSSLFRPSVPVDEPFAGPKAWPARLAKERTNSRCLVCWTKRILKILTEKLARSGWEDSVKESATSTSS